MPSLLLSEPAPISRVLDQAFRLTEALIRRMFGVLCIGSLSGGVYNVISLLWLSTSVTKFAGLPAAAGSADSSGALTGLAALVAAVLVFGVGAAVQYRAYEIAIDKPAPSVAWRAGFGRLPALIGGMLLILLMFMVPTGVAAAVVVGLWSVGQHAASVVAGVAAFAGVFCFLPRLMLFTPEVLYARLGPVRALKSSWHLTRGHLLRVSVIMIVAFAVAIGFSILVRLLLWYPSSLLADALALPLVLHNAVGTVLASLFSYFITMPAFAACWMSVWNDLRLRHGGGDLESKIDALPGAG